MALEVMKFTYGYMVYDWLDMLRMKGWRIHHLKEMSVHHWGVIAGCLTAIWYKRYIGYGMTMMLMEVNSVFLHTRALLQYANQREFSIFKDSSSIILRLKSKIIFKS